MPLSRRDFLTGTAAGALALAAGTGTGTRAEAAPLPPARLRELRAAVRGRVLAPGDAGYDGARVVFNRRFDRVRPPAVVQVRDAEDVRALVRWAGRRDVALVARSGGHAYHGGSTSATAVVVDLARLDGIALSESTARVGPAANTIDLYATLARRGVTVPAGSCPTVALGGLALGGGMGLAGRALGLTLDRIESLDVVTADGRLRTVDARNDEDLFWALRGGGGSFGIVTALRLRVHEVRRAAWFRATYPASAREEVLAAWDGLAPAAPDPLTAICTLTGTDATAFGQYLGPESALRRLVAPLGRIPGATLRTGTSDYLALQQRWAGCAGEPLAACREAGRSTFDASSIYVAERLSAAGRGAFLAAAGTGATLILDAYGGAINRVGRDDTAFAHRDVRFSVQILSYTDIPTARDRVRRARARIVPYGDGGAYPNYASLDLAGPLRAYYGANLARLRRIKAAVDPENRFRPAQGVPAARSAAAAALGPGTPPTAGSGPRCGTTSVRVRDR